MAAKTTTDTKNRDVVPANERAARRNHNIVYQCDGEEQGQRSTAQLRHHFHHHRARIDCSIQTVQAVVVDVITSLPARAGKNSPSTTTATSCTSLLNHSRSNHSCTGCCLQGERVEEQDDHSNMRTDRPPPANTRTGPAPSLHRSRQDPTLGGRGASTPPGMGAAARWRWLSTGEEEEAGRGGRLLFPFFRVPFASSPLFLPR